jgi:hypothetical protein
MSGSPSSISLFSQATIPGYFGQHREFRATQAIKVLDSRKIIKSSHLSGQQPL